MRIGFEQAQSFRSGKAAPAQTDHVDADEVSRRSLRHTPRNDVGANAAHSHDHRAPPDPNELANGSLAAEKTVVADADVAADHGIIGEGNVAADFAIMGHVGTGHEKTTVTDLGHSAVVFGAGVNGYVLADIAVHPDR